MDAFKNLAVGTVAVEPSPAASGTAFGVESLRAELDPEPPLLSFAHVIADGVVVHADGTTDEQEEPS